MSKLKQSSSTEELNLLLRDMHANAYLLLLISNNAISSQNRSINQQMQIVMPYVYVLMAWFQSQQGDPR